MSTNYVLEQTQIIPRSMDEVFGFFSDAGNLEALTPTWLNFKILTPRPIEMKAGTLIQYQISLFGIPMRWKTLIEEFTPRVRFIDRQLSGPYKIWLHTHEFSETPDGVRMVDRVEYAIPLGPLGHFAHWLFVKRMLNSIFDFRRQQVERLFPDGQKSPGQNGQDIPKKPSEPSVR